MYADYEYYKSHWMGKVITDEADYTRCAIRASAFIDKVTFNRIKQYPPSAEHESMIKFCACDLAELMHKMDQAEAANAELVKTDQGVHSGRITSVTSGSESISYASGSASGTIAAHVAGDLAEWQRQWLNSAQMYLANIPDSRGVNLLYAGGR